MVSNWIVECVSLGFGRITELILLQNPFQFQTDRCNIHIYIFTTLWLKHHNTTSRTKCGQILLGIKRRCNMLEVSNRCWMATQASWVRFLCICICICSPEKQVFNGDHSIKQALIYPPYVSSNTLKTSQKAANFYLIAKVGGARNKLYIKLVKNKKNSFPLNKWRNKKNSFPLSILKIHYSGLKQSLWTKNHMFFGQKT